MEASYKPRFQENKGFFRTAFLLLSLEEPGEKPLYFAGRDAAGTF